jgi:hypothetical protein
MGMLTTPLEHAAETSVCRVVREWFHMHRVVVHLEARGAGSPMRLTTHTTAWDRKWQSVWALQRHWWWWSGSYVWSTCHAVLCHAVLCRAVSCCAVSCCVMLCCAGAVCRPQQVADAAPVTYKAHQPPAPVSSIHALKSHHMPLHLECCAVTLLAS